MWSGRGGNSVTNGNVQIGPHPDPRRGRTAIPAVAAPAGVLATRRLAATARATAPGMSHASIDKGVVMGKHASSSVDLPEQSEASAARGAEGSTSAAQRGSAAGRCVVAGPEGRMLRPFALADAAGQQVRFRDYRQRRNLVLFFHHGGACAACRSVLLALATYVQVFVEAQAAVLGIGPDQGDQAHLPAAELGQAFLLLSDPGGNTAARAGLAVPALVAADRWGEIWSAWEGGEQHVLPHGDELVEWLTIIQCDCT